MRVAHLVQRFTESLASFACRMERFVEDAHCVAGEAQLGHKPCFSSGYGEVAGADDGRGIGERIGGREEDEIGPDRSLVS